MNSSTRANVSPSSLIICSRNRPTLLAETVESVLKGDELPTELVIIDQSDSPNSNLATFKSNRTCEIRYLWTRSVGLSRGRNMGVAEARHDILVIIDDDMFVTSNWFGSLVQALVSAEGRTVVTGRVLPTAPESPDGFVPALVVDENREIYEGRIGKDVLAGGHMAMYRAARDDVGVFDERLGAGSSFPSAEDNDFGYRLLEAGYRILYEPGAVLYHRAWRSGRDYLRVRWNYGLGKGGFYTKHLSLTDGHMLRRIGWDIGRRVLSFPRRIYREPRRACGDVFYSIGILFGTIQWVLSQRRMRNLRSRNDSTLGQ